MNIIQNKSPIPIKSTEIKEKPALRYAKRVFVVSYFLFIGFQHGNLSFIIDSTALDLIRNLSRLHIAQLCQLGGNAVGLHGDTLLSLSLLSSESTLFVTFSKACAKSIS